MRKDPVPLRQSASFCVLFLMGAFLIFGGSFRGGRDAWISLLIAGAGLLLWALVLARVTVLCPGKDLFGVMELLPRWLRLFFTVAVTVYCIEQTALILRSYAGFARIVSLPNTPVPILVFLCCVPIWMILRRDISFLCRFSWISALGVAGTVVFLFLSLIPRYDLSHLLPVLYRDTENVAVGALDEITYPFGNAFLLLGIIPFSDPKRTRRFWLGASATAIALGFLIVFQCLLSVGGELSRTFQYPYDFTASLINIGNFFTRIEALASLVFFLSVVVRCVYFSFLAIRGIRTLAPRCTGDLSLPFVLFLGAYSCVIFANTDAVFDYLAVLRYVAPPLQYGFPFLLWALAEFRAKKNPNGVTFSV